MDSFIKNLKFVKKEYYMAGSAINHMKRVLETNTSELVEGGKIYIPDLYPYLKPREQEIVDAINDIECIRATQECVGALELSPPILAALVIKCINLVKYELALDISGLDVFLELYTKEDLEGCYLDGEVARAMIQSGAATVLYSNASKEWKIEHRALSVLYAAGIFDEKYNASIQTFVVNHVYPLERATSNQKGLLHQIAECNKHVPCLSRLSAYVDSAERESLVASFQRLAKEITHGLADIRGILDSMDWKLNLIIILLAVIIAIVVGGIVIAPTYTSPPGQTLAVYGETPVALYTALAVVVFLAMAFVIYRCYTSRRGQ